MAVLVVKCDPKVLRIDESMYPDVETSYIYDHLKYYCSKFSPLPAATITLHGGSPVVVQGQKYVRIATELGRKSIRAIITGDTNTDEVQSFLRIEAVQILDWQLLRREEEETSVLDAEHVFFFESALSDHQKRTFEESVAGFFHQLQSVLLLGKPRTVTKVVYSHGDCSAEFIATTPAGDESWFGEFYASCLDFSRTVGRIASYQGRRFVS